MKQAIYVFCLLKQDAARDWEGPGLDEGSPLGRYDLGSLAALTCPVCLDDFSGPAAEDKLQDKEWLIPRLCRHEEVVEQAMTRSPVLPLQFGTIFSSSQALEEQVRPHREVVQEFLDQAASREEWSVKGYWDKAQALKRLSEAKQRQAAARLGSLSPGQRYFEEKRLAAAAKKELGQWLQQSCEAVGQALARHAVGLSRRSLLSGQRDGENREMAVNWAFWVPRGQVEQFKAQLAKDQEALGSQGLFFGCSGPWPPYSFTPRLESQPA